MYQGYYTIDHTNGFWCVVLVIWHYCADFCVSEKVKSKMASLIIANPSVISGHQIDIDDKTNQICERSRSTDWREWLISYWRWIYVLMTVERVPNTFLPECNRTGVRDIPHRKSMTMSRHHKEYRRKFTNKPSTISQKIFYSYNSDFIKSFCNKTTLIS